MTRRPPRPPPLPYTTLFRSRISLQHRPERFLERPEMCLVGPPLADPFAVDRAADLLRAGGSDGAPVLVEGEAGGVERSEEHTSELQSRLHLVCRLLLEKKKK